MTLTDTQREAIEDLATAIRFLLKCVKIDDTMYGLDNPVADVELVANPDDSAALVMTFDGAGFDTFTHTQGNAANSWRNLLVGLAEDRGFEMQDHNSWSIGFYT